MGYYGWKLREQHLFMDNAEKTADYSEQLLSSWRSKTGLYGDNKEKSSENIVKTVDLAIEYEKQTKSEFSSQIVIFIFFGLLSGGMSLIYLRRNTRTNNENEIIKKFYTKFGIVNNLYFNIYPTVKISILILSLLSVGYCNWYLGRYISVIGANADNAYQEFESYEIFAVTISRNYSIRDAELRQNTVISSIIEPTNSVAKSLGIVVKTGTEYSFYSNIFDFFILILISVIVASLYIEISDRATSSKSLRKELNPLRVKLQALDIFNKLYLYRSNKKSVVLSLLLIILASGLIFSFFSKKKLIDSPTAKASLTELKKINSRMEVGINLLEYPKELSNYKFVAETFINSNDSTINPRYTSLIKDALETHIHALNVWKECQTQRPDCKVEEIFNGQSTRKSSLISKLLTRYPNLNEKLKTIKASDTDNSFVSTTVEKNDMLQYLWSYAKAAEDSASIEINR